MLLKTGWQKQLFESYAAQLGSESLLVIFQQVLQQGLTLDPIAPVQRSQTASSFPLELRTELSFGCKHRQRWLLLLMLKRSCDVGWQDEILL